jgi:hypothetical protein
MGLLFTAGRRRRVDGDRTTRQRRWVEGRQGSRSGELTAVRKSSVLGWTAVSMVELPAGEKKGGG